MVVALAIYCKVSVRNFIQIRSGLTFLLYDVGVIFSAHSAVRQSPVMHGDAKDIKLQR